MKTRTRAVLLTLVSVIAGATALLFCAQLLIASHAAASNDQEHLDRIAKTYSASAAKFVENKWNNRTDVEMIIGRTVYDCLMPTEEQLAKSLPLKCTSYPYVATFA